MVPVCFQSRLGHTGHHVAQVEPAHCADSDHSDLFAARDQEYIYMKDISSHGFGRCFGNLLAL